MRAAHKVVWTEGLLMAPQHMQQQDLYYEALLCDRLDAVDPFNWGVLRIELDKKALSSNQVQLATFKGVLPDGVVLALDGKHAELPPSRMIGDHFPHTQQSLDVYLGLPDEREGIDNFAEQSAAPVRYAHEQARGARHGRLGQRGRGRVRAAQAGAAVRRRVARRPVVHEGARDRARRHRQPGGVRAVHPAVPARGLRRCS